MRTDRTGRQRLRIGDGQPALVLFRTMRADRTGRQRPVWLL